VKIDQLVVLLDGSDNAARAIPVATSIAERLRSRITLLSAVKQQARTPDSRLRETVEERTAYLNSVVTQLAAHEVEAEARVEIGSISGVYSRLIRENGFGLVITATRGGRGEHTWLEHGLSHKLVEKVDTPVLLVQVEGEGRSTWSGFSRILVALDGSSYSERVLPYARVLAKAFSSRLTLLCVPAVPEAQSYRAAADVRLKIREKAEVNMLKFLETTARPLRRDGVQVDVRVTGSIPAHSILAVAAEEHSDLVMLSSQGRGGYNAMLLGKVAEDVVEGADCPVFMLPIQGEAAATARVRGLIRSHAAG